MHGGIFALKIARRGEVTHANIDKLLGSFVFVLQTHSHYAFIRFFLRFHSVSFTLREIHVRDDDIGAQRKVLSYRQ